MSQFKGLLPCPFCAGTAMRKTDMTVRPMITAAGCPGCKVWTDEEIWNRRKPAVTSQPPKWPNEKVDRDFG